MKSLKAASRSLPPPLTKRKRRDNLLYRLRLHGIAANTKERVIFLPLGDNPLRFPQIKRLSDEFFFNIQYILT